MSRDRKNWNERRDKSPGYRRDKSLSREREGTKSKSKQKRDTKGRWNHSSNSEWNGRNAHDPSYSTHDYPSFNNDTSPWRFQPPMGPPPMGPPPMYHGNMNGSGGFVGGPLFMGGGYQMPGPVYHDFTSDYFDPYMNSHNYQRSNNDTYDARGLLPTPKGPRFGGDVLEKAETMVNIMAEKRKQATQDRVKNRRPLSGSKAMTKEESRHGISSKKTKALSAGNSPRLSTETWSMVTKSLYDRNPFSPSENRTGREQPCTSAMSAEPRESSPGRLRPTAKVDVSKVASKADPLSRASIAKLINAPRSTKEKQRLASFVKKTKTKTLRPKLTVRAVPEVGSVDPSELGIEGTDGLDLVELPEHLRRQVENLFEHGPLATNITTTASRDPGSPTKSPVAKKAKTDLTEGEKDNMFVKLELLSEDELPDLPELPVTETTLPVTIKAEPVWDTESIVSDVTSVGEPDVDRRPFERLADRVTADPKLNDILNPCPNNAVKERPETPSESDLLDTPRIEELVHQALGISTKNEGRDHERADCEFKRPADPVKRRSRDKGERSPSRKNPSSNDVNSSNSSQSTDVTELIETKNVSRQVANQTDQAGVKSVERAPGVNGGDQASPNRQSHASMVSGFIKPETDPAADYQSRLASQDLQNDQSGIRGRASDTDVNVKPLSAMDLLDSVEQPLDIVSKALALAKSKLRDMGDSLMSLHLTIHNPPKTEDTVNQVLDITEREENLCAETSAIDSYVEILTRQIAESQTEFERLMKLRERVRGDAELLRKQRLDVLRSAVSKKKENDVTSSENRHHQVTSSTDASPAKADSDADQCSTDSAATTPRNADRQPSREDPGAMQYVASISMDLLESGHLWKSLSSVSEQEYSDNVLDKAASSSFENIAMPVLDGGHFDEVDPPQTRVRDKKRFRLRNQAQKLGVKVLERRKKLKSKPEISVPKDSPKKKDKKDVLLVMCRKLASPVDSKREVRKLKDIDSRQARKAWSEGSTPRMSDVSNSDMETDRGHVRFDTGTDDVTNDESQSELDCPEKVKARLLKAVTTTQEKEKNRSEMKRNALKTQLLESLEDRSEQSKSCEIADPLVKSTMLDHMIVVKLERCNAALQQLKESKLRTETLNRDIDRRVKEARTKTRSTSVKDTSQGRSTLDDFLKGPRPIDSNRRMMREVRNEKQASPVPSSADLQTDCSDDVSILSDDVTGASVTSKDTSSSKRRKPKRRHDKAQKPVVMTSSESEFDNDHVTFRSRPSKKDVFPSDSRKEKLRQMGVILSASELEEFCKDGHNISDRESNSEIVTARTEDLLIQTPRTDLDTARTEDLLKGMDTPRTVDSRTTTPLETPPDDSDNYSSCVEEQVDVFRPLQSTGESFDFSLLGSSHGDSNWRNIKDRLLAESTVDTADESRIEEKFENEQSKEALSTDRSDDVAEYRERIVKILEQSSESDVDVKRERLDTDDDVMFLGAAAAASNPTSSNPTSARSDNSAPSVGEKMKFKGHTTAVTAMVLHGRYIYTSSPQNNVILKHDVDTGECVHVFKTQSENIYTMAALDFNGKSYLYTGGYDRKLVKYDLETNECLFSTLLPIKIRCICTRWNKVFIGLCSGEIVSLNPENDTLKSIVVGEKSVSCMDTGQEGPRQVLVVGSFDPLISIHDAKNGLLLRTISSHTRVPLSVQVCHNVVYSAGADKCIKVHDLNSGNQIHSVQLRHPVTDLVVYGDQLYVACFDGVIRCYSKELELKRLYYGAGKNYLLRLGIQDGKLYSTNKNGCVESAPIVDALFMCPCKECHLGYGLIGDLEYHVTEKHIHWKMDNNTLVYYCSWIGCCFETQKKMDLENHLLNHVEILANEDPSF